MGDVVVRTQGPSHRRPRSRFRSCRGQSLVELALIAPFLIILALGITLILAGLAIHFSAIIFGVILALVATLGWITEPGYEYPSEDEHH